MEKAGNKLRIIDANATPPSHNYNPFRCEIWRHDIPQEQEGTRSRLLQLLNPLRIDRFRVVDEMSYREEKKVISPPRFIWTTRRWTVFRVDGPSFGGKHAERKITNSRVAGEAETERRKRRMGGLGGACDDEINNRPTRKLRKLVLLCSDRCGFSPRKDEEEKGRIPDE